MTKGELHPQPLPGPPLRLWSFVLHDVQGLFGGNALWAIEGRAAIIQVVGPPPAGRSGLWEKRSEIALTADQWAEVERLVGHHHFLTLTMANRHGIPDEAQPTIFVVTKSGVTARAKKWAGDSHPDFDPVYSYLGGLCHIKGKIVYEGAYEWDWQPGGFDKIG